jgi:hypothetical protein
MATPRRRASPDNREAPVPRSSGDRALHSAVLRGTDATGKWLPEGLPCPYRYNAPTASCLPSGHLGLPGLYPGQSRLAHPQDEVPLHCLCIGNFPTGTWLDPSSFILVKGHLRVKGQKSVVAHSRTARWVGDAIRERARGGQDLPVPGEELTEPDVSSVSWSGHRAMSPSNRTNQRAR